MRLTSALIVCFRLLSSHPASTVMAKPPSKAMAEAAIAAAMATAAVWAHLLCDSLAPLACLAVYGAATAAHTMPHRTACHTAGRD